VHTLLLDGVCPEIGPAIVFTTQYDLTGALFLKNGDPTLNAAALTPYIRLGRRLLWVSNYFNGHRTSLRGYPYGRATFVYDYARRAVYPLVDWAAARRYFGTQRALLDCPPIRSFKWGIHGRWGRFAA
jgi:hypothetical protein